MQLSIAIHSCSKDASITLAIEGQPTHHIQLDPQSRTAATITPALDSLLEQVRTSGQPLDYIAVTDGPGSFTGLRIGVTTAKTLGYALGIKIVAVDSLAAMAFHLWAKQPDATAAMVAINAYRGQVFAATWTREQWATALDSGEFATQSRVVLAAQWLSEVAAADPAVAIGAETVIANRSGYERVLPVEPNASEVAMLGHLIAAKHLFVSPMQLLPRYLRDSAAEEKLL